VTATGTTAITGDLALVSTACAARCFVCCSLLCLDCRPWTSPRLCVLLTVLFSLFASPLGQASQASLPPPSRVHNTCLIRSVTTPWELSAPPVSMLLRVLLAVCSALISCRFCRHHRQGPALQLHVDCHRTRRNDARSGQSRLESSCALTFVLHLQGVYCWTPADVQITGVLTLSGSATGQWVFQLAGILTVTNGASISLIGGASACRVFWAVSSASLGTTAVFKGTILGAPARD
jgi:hypothetical protein